MKAISINKIVLVLIVSIPLISCEKNNAATENSNLFNTTSLKTADANCKTCETENKTYDLVDQLKTMPLKEGNNNVVTLANGVRVVAQVKGGIIVNWYIHDKVGKIYNPASITNTQRVAMRLGRRYNVYKYCMILDGSYTCWYLICFNSLKV